MSSALILGITLASPAFHLSSGSATTLVYRRAGHLVAKDRIESHIQQRSEALLGRESTSHIAQTAGLEMREEQAMAAKDSHLAHSNTRQWCLDRCISLGYCDAVEDLLKMTTAQVRTFCEECASFDECALDEGLVDTYISRLYAAATNADGSSFCYD